MTFSLSVVRHLVRQQVALTRTASTRGCKANRRLSANAPTLRTIRESGAWGMERVLVTQLDILATVPIKCLHAPFEHGALLDSADREPKNMLRGNVENMHAVQPSEGWYTDNPVLCSDAWKMMTSPTINIDDMAYAIQLALTPVFLLTGIAGMLNVMTGRLARIIDRGRHVAESSRISAEDIAGPLRDELAGLERRRHLASAAITACTFSALLVCTVVAALFLEVLLKLNFKILLGILFTGATFALVTGLAYFLREVHLATRTVRIPFAPRL